MVFLGKKVFDGVKKQGRVWNPPLFLCVGCGECLVWGGLSGDGVFPDVNGVPTDNFLVVVALDADHGSLSGVVAPVFDAASVDCSGGVVPGEREGEGEGFESGAGRHVGEEGVFSPDIGHRGALAGVRDVLDGSRHEDALDIEDLGQDFHSGDAAVGVLEVGEDGGVNAEFDKDLVGEHEGIGEGLAGFDDFGAGCFDVVDGGAVGVAPHLDSGEGPSRQGGGVADEMGQFDFLVEGNFVAQEFGSVNVGLDGRVGIGAFFVGDDGGQGVVAA